VEPRPSSAAQRATAVTGPTHHRDASLAPAVAFGTFGIGPRGLGYGPAPQVHSIAAQEPQP